MKTVNDALVASKPRYEILDGLRGVAAVFIVIYHLCEGCGVMLGHGYLGVDFFYALSGFVIGYAYDNRWGKLSMGEFFKRRIVRLHPMVIMGTLLGLLLFYFGASAAFPIIAQAKWWKVLLLFVMCCFMIPMPKAWDIRGWQDFNSFNGNIWSLYWEYAANILYAFIFRRLPTLILALLALIAACGTLDLTLNIDLFGVFSAERVNDAYTVNGGWSMSADQLYIGAVRVLYPFLAGLVLARVNTLIKIHSGFWWCSLFVLLLLATPRISGIGNGIFEAAAILIALPLIISIGAGSEISHPKSIAACRFLGEISYPLYITHLPLVYLQIAWVSNHPEASHGTIVMLSASLFFLSIGVAYACLKLYDIPVRAWLGNRWLAKK